jgi:hypothetical protein
MGTGANCHSGNRRMKTRRQFQGMMAIARFNWPFYVVVFVILCVSATAFFLLSSPLKVASAIAFGCAAYFLIVSLFISYIIYDRSDLYRWSWLDRALQGISMRRAIFCHSGFDETSADLQEHFRDVQWTILDHFDPKRMTERSIHRARTLFPPTRGTLACPYDAWSLPAESADVVFGLLAVHELRSEAERTAWFTEANRRLRNGGRIVLAEHMRDWANFLAFGPGFLHFHSLHSWRRCWQASGLRCINHFSVTPFVQIIVLTKQ